MSTTTSGIVLLFKPRVLRASVDTETPLLARLAVWTLLVGNAIALIQALSVVAGGRDAAMGAAFRMNPELADVNAVLALFTVWPCIAILGGVIAILRRTKGAQMLLLSGAGLWTLHVIAQAIFKLGVLLPAYQTMDGHVFGATTSTFSVPTMATIAVHVVLEVVALAVCATLVVIALHGERIRAAAERG